MKIDIATARYLLDHLRNREIQGRCLSFGKLDPQFTFEQLGRIMESLGMLSFDRGMLSVTPRQKAAIDRFTVNGRLLSHKPHEAQRGFVSDEFFYCFAGFDDAYSVDHGNFEHGDYAFDLNALGLSDIVGTFDVVLDAGMMVSVFHTPNFLNNIHDVLNVGGVIVHQAPSNNFVDRGFYQYSPLFFLEYYRANDFSDIHVSLQRRAGELILNVDYRPGLLSEPLDGAKYVTQCFARKTATSTRNRLPNLGSVAHFGIGN